MLARQLLRAVNVKQTAPALSSFVRTAFTEGPERDLKNFPRPVRAEESSPVRLMFIPEEWFDFFYKKTGVTGPYCLGGGYLMYAISKEIWVIEHDFPFVCAFFTSMALVKWKFGDAISKYVSSQVNAHEEEMKEFRNSSLDSSKNHIEHLKKEIWRTDAQKEVFTVKRENVAMQLEAEYRRRAFEVYNQVKSRLDYQAGIENIDRRIAHKHMVQWIIDNVKKSITPQQEKDSLKRCFADLQALAVKG